MNPALVFFIIYLGVGGLMGLLVCATITPEEIAPFQGNLRLARLLAVPFYMLVWPIQLFYDFWPRKGRG